MPPTQCSTPRWRGIVNRLLDNTAGENGVCVGVELLPQRVSADTVAARGAVSSIIKVAFGSTQDGPRSSSLYSIKHMKSVLIPDV